MITIITPNREERFEQINAALVFLEKITKGPVTMTFHNGPEIDAILTTKYPALAFDFLQFLKRQKLELRTSGEES